MPSVSRKVAYIPTPALVGFLVVILSWLLTLLLWIGQWMTGGQWPGNLKLIVCLLLSAVATIYLVAWGRPALRAHPIPRGHAIALTGWQALWVTIMVIAFGAFGTWLVWGPPHVAPWIG